MPPMIETTNLTKRYGELMALSNLNLTIEAGQCFGFIGPNGAGKTTSIKILATLLKPTWGEARVDGLSVGPVNARQVRSIIGYVPDYFGSYDDMVVEEYLGFFAASYGITGDQRKQVIGDVLDLTDLAYKRDAEVNSLSRGMQQRLSVARVLLHDPKVADLCDVVGVMEQGELKFTGTMEEILERAQQSGGAAVLTVGVDGKQAQAAALLKALPGVSEVQPTKTGTLKVTFAQRAADSPSAAGPPPAAAVAKALIEGGFALTRLDEEQMNLETAFMRLTKGLVQ